LLKGALQLSIMMLVPAIALMSLDLAPDPPARVADRANAAVVTAQATSPSQVVAQTPAPTAAAVSRPDPDQVASSAIPMAIAAVMLLIAAIWLIQRALLR
jgi:hypothetical protein